MLAPIEVAAIYDYTANCSSMAANPLCRGVDDNVGAVFDGLEVVATSAKSVIDLQSQTSVLILPYSK